MDVLKRICAGRIVPVAVIDRAEDAVETAQALLDGGIDSIEITFRTAAAEEAIAAVCASCPEMLTGAGTVITLEQCKCAVAAGAKFIVSPGLDEEVVNWCLAQGVPVIPGCATPTEMMQAMKLGLTTVKFFPANVYGGASAIKALGGPFGQLKFIPTGGVNAENLREYLALPQVAAVGGSWMCAKNDVLSHNFDRIRELSRQASDIVKEAETK
ncbi:MAG: bifunctional 4-hydroxy-2-oxoglutarate aldolase/2-dehydro-3-deoxy-phosphogluconate aldolase [Clostridia bacterium]|nr:bifunctional 4-hydroxy-2-oxoglutarate aldolase/2-dehydro-3-deoxy-phosphogluconate aldolase [Clostridia bacterium]